MVRLIGIYDIIIPYTAIKIKQSDLLKAHEIRDSVACLCGFPSALETLWRGK